MSYKKEIILKGLSCANCAREIELKVQSFQGIKAANLNFATSRLNLEVEDQNEWPDMLRAVTDAAEAIEPELQVIESGKTISRQLKDPKEGLIDRWRVIGLLTGLAAFLTAFILTLPDIVEYVLFLLAYLAAGSEVLWIAVKKILKGQLFDEYFLMAVATIGALALGEFAEACGVMLFYQTGNILQDRAVDRSRRSIGALLDIKPDHANLQTSQGVQRVAPDLVKVGDLIVIKPGERVPLDGVVKEGHSMLDTSALTGEPVPREVLAGDPVYAGSVNKNGMFVIEVTRAFSESTVARILELVENASSRKAPTENFISKFARYYSPIVVGAAALLAFLPPLLIPGALLSDWVNRALIFLVISCPCALVISIPLGFFGGIGGASRQGILFKGSNYMEALNQVDTVIFDKTGTLTRGAFNVTRIHSEKEGGDAELLELAARAEVFSNHPIAQSILHAYGRRLGPDDLAEMTGHEELPGLGVAIRWNGRQILAGKARLLARDNIAPAEPPEYGTVVHVALDGEYMGYLVISDEVKPDALKAIQALGKIGIDKIILFTGDSQAAGESIGKSLGISAVHGELLPDQKVVELELLEKLKAPRSKILFVGDGINDAPVLARADVGIAMGGLGSDAAIEAADIVIMTDEPSKVATAISIARRTRRIVWQNIFFALAVKAVFLSLGAAGLASMWEAVFADVGVTLLAVFNAMRVLRSRTGKNT
jgi:Zn2+/Cd2+-exporting ATPase